MPKFVQKKSSVLSRLALHSLPAIHFFEVVVGILQPQIIVSMLTKNKLETDGFTSKEKKADIFVFISRTVGLHSLALVPFVVRIQFDMALLFYLPRSQNILYLTLTIVVFPFTRNLRRQRLKWFLFFLIPIFVRYRYSCY